MKREYKGFGAIAGVGRGKAMIIDISPPHYEIRDIEDSDRELGRFVRMLKKFCENTRKLSREIEKTVGKNESCILDSHIKMTHDLALQSEMITKISNGMCAEQATNEICDLYITRFMNADQDFVRQLAVDVKDVRLCILNLLLGIGDVYVESFMEDTILIGKELTPSIIARIDRKHTKGIVVESGSPQSHSAQLIKAMNIPGITYAENIHNLVKDGDIVTMDGSTGTIIVE